MTERVVSGPPATIAVVIPTYKARESILGVLEKIGPEVSRIYVIDDCCPHRTGDLVTDSSIDPRVQVIRHDDNQGVGGATMTGYRAAITEGADVIVKIDSDGQMDPALIPFFATPIALGNTDYTKGNRFFDRDSLSGMPKMRIFGNAILSIMTKFSTGYWNIFDPTNGYTAIHARVADLLPMDRINKRYFFETDMLYQLNTYRAAVWDIPMRAHYGTEESGLSISRIIGPFMGLHAKKFVKRIIYNYFLRDFSFASLCLTGGVISLIFGIVYGGTTWLHALRTGSITPTGTIMIIALALILGTQLLLTFFAADTASTPRHAIHPLLSRRVLRPLQQFRERNGGAATPPTAPAPRARASAANVQR